MFTVRGDRLRDELLLLLSFASGLVSSFRGLGSWQDPVLVADTTVRPRGVGRFRVRRHTDDLWHVFPFRERAVYATIRALLKPGDCFVDAGANIGFYSIAASALVGTDGRVVAIEMMPETARILHRHVELNGAYNVEVVERALTAAVDERIRAFEVNGKSGQATVNGAGQSGAAIEVITTTLDEALAGIGPIRLIKMDIEGAERVALEGAKAVLDRTEAVIFETRLGEEDGVASVLKTLGFAVSRLDGRNCLASRRVDRSADA